jgi:crossover junction endodeoxyribonuclease RuvC
MTQIIGLDPGTTGALAQLALVGDRIEFLGATPFPILRVSRGGSTKNDIDVAALRNLLDDVLTDQTIYIERVGAMPGQGVSSSFQFGRALGQLEGLLAAFCCKTEYVEASAWKKRFDLLSKVKGKKADKSMSMAAAIRMWPSKAEYFRASRGWLTKDQAIANADAALIGCFGHERALARVGKILVPGVVHEMEV